jgi:uncharacterized SAM-binding protein YcdF (DUF218 family)
LSATCTRAAGYLAHAALEWPYPPSDEVPADAQAIVVLAGYARPADGTLPGPELGVDTLYRCVHAAKLHRKARHLPVLVSGGPIRGSRASISIAQLMRDFLMEQDVDESDLIVEGRSENTYENSVESGKLLRERGIHCVVLVTDAEHMLRAASCFRKQGIDVIPSPVRPWEPIRNNLDDYLPNPREAGDFEGAVLEWQKIAYYWLRGRF